MTGGERDGDLVSIVTHELRAPITIIAGFAEMLLRRDHLGLSDEQLDDLFGRMLIQATRAARLVDDLLAMSQIESGRFEVDLGPVNLVKAVEAALDGAPVPGSKRLELAIPQDLWVVADRARLEQVVINMLTNGYKYGGDAIALDARRTTDGVLATFADDGDGVEEELIPRLFEQFTRGTARRGTPGTGLGLANTKALVEAFGGRIWYDRGSSSGARFRILLQEATRPSAEKANSTGPAIPDVEVGHERHERGPVATVLIVDDEPDLRFLITLTLESAGYAVVEAGHGAAALKLVDETRPDVVITDLMMPVMDGRALIERLRADPATSSIPILVISANPDGAVGDAALRKPFQPSALLETVASLLERHG